MGLSGRSLQSFKPAVKPSICQSFNQSINQSINRSAFRRHFSNIHHTNHPRSAGYQPNKPPTTALTTRRRIEKVIGPIQTASRNTFVTLCAIASLSGFAAIVYYLFLDASQKVHSQSFNLLNKHPKLVALIGSPIIDVSENSRGYRSTSSRRWENGSKFVTVAYAVKGSHGSASLCCEMKRVNGQWVLNYAFADQYVRNKLRRVWIEDHRAELMAQEQLASQG